MLTVRRFNWLLLAALLSAVQFGADLMAQSCPSEGVVLNTQADVDIFAKLYADCQHIGGSLKLGYKLESDINNLSSLSNIRSIGGDLIITDNADLVDLRGLDALTSIGGVLRIASNRALMNLNGLEQLRWIGGSVRLSANRSLVDLGALGQLTQVNGDFSISDNSDLQDLAGLESLLSVRGHVIVNDNATLFSLQGLDGLGTIGLDLLVQNNGHLRSLDGLENIRDIGESLLIDNNPFLQDISGLSRLQSIGRNLQITNNASLLTVQGLDSLHTMNGLLQFFNNPELLNLTPLDGLSHEGIQDLAILSSEKLSACQALSICDYLKIAGNSASIRSNDDGCNSREEVLKHCPGDGGNSSPHRRGDSVFFPNPTSGEIFVRGETEDGDRFQVIDAIGKKIAHGLLDGNKIDLTNLPSGCYFVEYFSGEGAAVEAVIKVE